MNEPTEYEVELGECLSMSLGRSSCCSRSRSRSRDKEEEPAKPFHPPCLDMVLGLLRSSLRKHKVKESAKDIGSQWKKVQKNLQKTIFFKELVFNERVFQNTPLELLSTMM